MLCMSKHVKGVEIYFNLQPLQHASTYIAFDVDVVKCPMRWTKGALEALHEAAENYMVGLMEDANLLAIHAW